MSEKKKSAAGILTLLVLCCVLGGCNAGTPATGTDITRVTVILPHFDDGYWTLIEEGIEQSGEKIKKNCGMDIKILKPQLNYNIPQMVELLKQQIAAKVDVLVVQGNEDEEYIDTLKEAWSEGIQIICVDTDIKSFPEHLYIGTDNYEAGKMLGEELINATGGEANVAVISGEPGFSNLEERLEGLQDAVKDYPKIHLGDVQYDNYDGLTVMKMYYQNAKDADTIVFLEGTGGVTISSQFRQRDDQYEHILGFDAFYGVISGAIDGIIKQDTRRMGEQVVEEIANYIRNGEYSSETVYTTTHWMTAENYHSILSDAELEYAKKWNSGGRTQ